MEHFTNRKSTDTVSVSVHGCQCTASHYVAQRIAQLIQEKDRLGLPTVLGLATGNTPIELYKELVRLHRDEGLSFRNVITFNLDEYYPMASDDPNSYVRFMHQHLFDHIDIQPHHIHIPNGELTAEEILPFCKAYEDRIAALGGIDFQILGIGLTGHIGFNEPGSMDESVTRLVDLNPLTREVAIQDFDGLEQVPTHAITMGVRTITQAKQIVLMAWSDKKAPIIQKAIQDPISSLIPATYLQNKIGVEFVLDKGSASLLQ